MSHSEYDRLCITMQFNTVFELGDGLLLVSYNKVAPSDSKFQISEWDGLPNVNIVIAAAITAYARIVMSDYLVDEK